ncbi:MAG: glutamine--fructose-6-phosphate transaminase (isomerizing) [Candidatus Omnitrophica bacterium]|nr:glutamine--fructose-6-phosphate transaminase (isomerizing) [Candidatus Omnitrophota bacterium]MCB9782693.1 glutamine--fructose-6-phosphate transaminase (isomerizing) [Candidatus Omnitrophota bacterium]
MCGIVAYLGKKKALPILLEGLKRLEYRGYDSAGLAIANGKLRVWKSEGRITRLEEKVAKENLSATTGIAHTRWATHGAPNETNAHPHCDQSGRIAVVHNGIIENYQTIRAFLEKKGIVFASETDSEVLAQLIGHLYKGDLEEAVRAALKETKGTYGIAVISSEEPDRIVAACNGSPLVLGIGEGEFLIASDAGAIVQHTTQVVRLGDGEVAVLDREGFRTTTLDAKPIEKEIADVEYSLEEIELGGFEHYMAKEIFEQPKCLEDSLRGRMRLDDGKIVLGGLAQLSREIVRARRIILTGCGSAWHACLVGEYLLEELARIPVEVEYASELRYRNPIIEEGAVVIAVSQSGETADTLAAVREVRDKGAMVLGIVNSVGSAIPKETDAGVYLHVGPEIGVASTKAYTGQLLVFTLLALYLGRRKNLSEATLIDYLGALSKIPDQIQQTLKLSDSIRDAAKDLVSHENWLFLGRGFNYPTALEGALKLKEISYIHAEGMPAAEMKHGPIALINEGMPVVFVATKNSQHSKIMSNIEEVKSRGGKVIAIATEGDTAIAARADQVFFVPDTLEPLQPLLAVVPLQLLAYHAALLRGCNVDKPRNLAKSVTVE